MRNRGAGLRIEGGRQFRNRAAGIHSINCIAEVQKSKSWTQSSLLKSIKRRRSIEEGNGLDLFDSAVTAAFFENILDSTPGTIDKILAGLARYPESTGLRV